MHITPVLKGSTTVAGEPVEYPAQQPEITAVRVQIAPGQGTNFITHPVPTFIYVLEGTLSEEYEDGAKQTYDRGSAFLQSMQKAHRRRNLGTKPVTILVVYVSEVGKVNAVAAHPAAKRARPGRANKRHWERK